MEQSSNITCSRRKGLVAARAVALKVAHTLQAPAQRILLRPAHTRFS
jgi:hypothetical protein